MSSSRSNNRSPSHSSSQPQPQPQTQTRGKKHLQANILEAIHPYGKLSSSSNLSPPLKLNADELARPRRNPPRNARAISSVPPNPLPDLKVTRRRRVHIDHPPQTIPNKSSPRRPPATATAAATTTTTTTATATTAAPAPAAAPTPTAASASAAVPPPQPRPTANPPHRPLPTSRPPNAEAGPSKTSNRPSSRPSASRIHSTNAEAGPSAPQPPTFNNDEDVIGSLTSPTLTLTSNNFAQLLSGLPRLPPNTRMPTIFRPDYLTRSVEYPEYPKRNPEDPVWWPYVPVPFPSERGEQVYHPPPSQEARRQKLAFLETITNVKVESIPSAYLCADLLHAQQSLRPFMRNAASVYFSALALDQMREWSDRNDGVWHPFLRAILKLTKVEEVCFGLEAGVSESNYRKSRLPLGMASAALKRFERNCKLGYQRFVRSRYLFYLDLYLKLGDNIIMKLHGGDLQIQGISKRHRLYEICWSTSILPKQRYFNIFHPRFLGKYSKAQLYNLWMPGTDKMDIVVIVDEAIVHSFFREPPSTDEVKRDFLKTIRSCRLKFSTYDLPEIPEEEEANISVQPACFKLNCPCCGFDGADQLPSRSRLVKFNKRVEVLGSRGGDAQASGPTPAPKSESSRSNRKRSRAEERLDEDVEEIPRAESSSAAAKRARRA